MARGPCPLDAPEVPAQRLGGTEQVIVGKELQDSAEHLALSFAQVLPGDDHLGLSGS